MKPDITRITELCKDILDLRERILNEIPEFCPISDDLCDKAIDARIALKELYKELDKILLSMDC